MPKISEHPCERCSEPADFSVRAIGTAITFYLCKGCMKKPDVCEWARETIKKKMEAKTK
jgi:hypothetical protein